MAAKWFENNESGYMKWCADHSNGYVVNTKHPPGPNYVVLHRANCRTIDPAAPKSPGGFTGPSYAKCCAETIEDLRAALRYPFSKICKLCHPEGKTR